MIKENLKCGETYCISNIKTKFAIIFKVVDETPEDYHIEILESTAPYRLNKINKKARCFTEDGYALSKYPISIPEIKKLPTDPIDIQYAYIAENVLDYSFYTFRINSLKKQIEEALKNNDKKLFLKLTDELKSIEPIEKKFTTV